MSLLIYLLIASNWCFGDAVVSDKRKCIDEKCSVAISLAKTLIRYSAPEPGYLSVRPGDEVTVYSKEAGNNVNLWGIELNGKRGYIPFKFLKEFKYLTDLKPELLVDIESEFAPKVPSNSPEALVIDGTTLYDDIVPSSTQYQVPPATEVPVKEESLKEEHFPEKNEDVKRKEVNPHEDDEGDDEDDDVKIENEEDDEDFDEEEEEEEEGTNRTETPQETNKLNHEMNTTDKLVTPDPHMAPQDPLSQTLTDNEVINIKTIQSELPLHEHSVNTESNGTHPLDSGVSSVGKVPEHASPSEIKQDEAVVQPGLLPITEKGHGPKPTSLPLFFHSVPSTPVPTGGIPTVVPSSDVPDKKGLEGLSNTQADIKLVSGNIPETKLATGDSTDAVRSGIPPNRESYETSSMPSVIKPKNPSTEEVKDKENESPASQEQLDGLPPSENWVPNNKEAPQYKKESSMNTFPPSDDLTIPEVPSVETITPVVPQELNDFRPLDDPKYPSGLGDHIAEHPLDTEYCDTDLCKADVSEVPIQEVETQEEPGGSFGYFGSSNSELSTQPSLNYIKKEVEEDSSSGKQEDQDETRDEVIVTDEKKEGASEENINIHVEPSTEGSWIDVSPLLNDLQSEEVTTEMRLIEAETDHNAESYDRTAPPISYVDTEHVEDHAGGWFDSMMGMFGAGKGERSIFSDVPNYEEKNDDVLLSQYASDASCSVDDAHCYSTDQSQAAMLHKDLSSAGGLFDFLELNDAIFIVAISGACVVLFLWGYMLIEKMRKEGPLVGKINQLEQQLLILAKENEVLSTKLVAARGQTQEINENVSSELVLELQKELDESSGIRFALEEQIQSLEKELENSTEVGLELNKMLSDVLSSQHGSDTVMANIEQLQKQLIEQQSTINNISSKLNEKDTENHELQLELEINNKKVIDLQAELEKMMLNLLKAEEEKEAVVSKTEAEVVDLRTQLAKIKAGTGVELSKITKDFAEVKTQLVETRRKFELKSKEYNLLRETLSDSDANKSFVDQCSLKAELQQLQQDNKTLIERLAQDRAVIKNFEEQHVVLTGENRQLVKRYEEADREKLEALTKLEVLSSYFKEKEAELQRELSKHEAMWTEKQGEATSTSERIKFMQAEIQNFKTQVASLQQEIVSQEVDLKSQISVLEKKAHENWVAARQAERRIEDSRQEAAQLRNRLTLRERSLNEDKSQNRNGVLSPLESNGVDHLNDAASPPLLFGAREHLTTSPPLLPGLPPGFPIPPPGVGVPPFMQHALPPGMPFMPPPPAMFPGDHRPPPLGRMSSPPLNSRYTPDSRAFSPYDRHSPSPTDDDYYDRDYHDERFRSKRDNRRRSGYSSASNSNESLDKLERSNSKV